jgi:hypothetical protein
MTVDVLEKTFPVSGQAVLALSNIRGAVNINIGRDDVIHVIAEKVIDSGDADNTAIIMEQINEGRVLVETSFSSMSGFLSGKKPCKVEYQVTVPPNCSLKLSCVSSSCTLVGKLGDIKLKTVSGPVNLSAFEGVFDVDAVSGDIVVENMKGMLSYKTVSGDLSVKDSSLNSVRGSSVSGDAVIQSHLSEGIYKFNSVSGDVRLSIPEGTGCILRTSSISGKFKTNLPQKQIRNNGRDKEVELGKGGPLVRFSSISGDIIIHSEKNSWDEIDQDREVDTDGDPERLEILSLIESGQISVEEGLDRLKSK